MNKTTLEIAEYIAQRYQYCDMSLAIEIQQALSIDASECTTRELHREIELVYRAYLLINATAVN